MGIKDQFSIVLLLFLILCSDKVCIVIKLYHHYALESLFDKITLNYFAENMLTWYGANPNFHFLIWDIIGERDIARLWPIEMGFIVYFPNLDILP